MPELSTRRNLLIVALAAIAGLFLWSYWPTLEDLANRWSTEPTYSHGYLVPFFAATLLWMRREKLRGQTLAPSVWGLVFGLVALFMRMGSGYFALSSVDRFSIIPALVGLCIGLGGRPALRWAWPGIAFLIFMLPLPAGFDQLLSAPMQHLATIASAHVLQTLGFIAEVEGNVIVLSDSELEVVEACSGLRMFVTFCALTTAVAVLMKASWLRKLIIVLSAFPLAMLCNIARISATGVVQQTLGIQAAHIVFHDIAGWLMIALALALLFLELKTLAYLFVLDRAQRPASQLRDTLTDYGFIRPNAKRLRADVKGPVTPASLAEVK
ncbi:MAG: exosortase/archaeosortase family protein [Gemmataceae bacterium]